MMQWERVALHIAAVNAVNAFEHGQHNVDLLKHTVQEIVRELGGTLKVGDMTPAEAALYITVLYLRKEMAP